MPCCLLKNFKWKCRRSSRMGRKRLFLTCLISCFGIITLKFIFHAYIDPADDSFTDINTCPACYGENLCPQFFHGHVILIGGSRLKYFQFFNRKNVYYGKFGRDRIVLKKLAHDWEIKEADRNLCKLANLYFCDAAVAIFTIVLSVPYTKDLYFTRILKKLRISTDFAACPSERLLSHIYMKLTNNGIDNKTLINTAVAEMMYGIYINPESVILQAFTQNEGWPFPQFKGSCGRLIVEEYVGHSLLNYEDSSWRMRLDLSYQLLQLAQQLTDNSLGFAFYLTDVTMDNFAVRPDGTLLLIDVENVVIVDRLKIRKEKAPGWNHMHRSTGEACHDCLNFSHEDLCAHDMSDHNFYAICKGLLIPHAYYSSRGLLHSIPPDVEQRTNISSLLSECADPSSDIGRFIAVPKLLQVMKSLL